MSFSGVDSCSLALCSGAFSSVIASWLCVFVSTLWIAAKADASGSRNKITLYSRGQTSVDTYPVKRLENKTVKLELPGLIPDRRY